LSLRRGVQVGGVAALLEEKRGLRLPHGLERRHKRLLRLEQHAQDDTIVLSETQIRLLERHSVEFRLLGHTQR
jgi:hypothetical protein